MNSVQETTWPTRLMEWFSVLFTGLTLILIKKDISGDPLYFIPHHYHAVLVVWGVLIGVQLIFPYIKNETIRAGIVITLWEFMFIFFGSYGCHFFG